MPSITFLGGTSTVTGSKFLVRNGKHRVLVDCGIFQGPRELRQRNWRDPFDDRPGEVLITHAHIDHTGYLPRLVGKDGFEGPIIATSATVDLMGVMLPDSARLQEEEAAYRNRKGLTRHQPALPLYTEADARAALQLATPVRYHEWHDGTAGRYRFTFAGHILGSSHITLEMGDRRVVFSGDIGRWDIPVLKDPEPPPAADLVVMESTYGDRVHVDGGPDPDDELAGIVNRAVERRGVLLIPAFAVGRTQEVLYRLGRLEDAGRIPRIPVFLDSPMAIDATALYRRHVEEHDFEMRELNEEGLSPLRPGDFTVTRTVDESKRLNSLSGPAIIISASGMATGGRIVHHLKRRLPEPSTIVLFVGYQAAGTRGRYLVEGAKEITIHHGRVPVRAEVTRMGSFSAHADRNELLRWLREAQAPPARVALVHGEPDARRNLAAAIRSELGIEVLVPEEGDTVEV